MQTEKEKNYWGTLFDGLFLLATGILIFFIVAYFIIYKGTFGIKLLATGCILVCVGLCLIVFPLEERIIGKDSLQDLLSTLSVFSKFILGLYISLGILLSLITKNALSYNDLQLILYSWLAFIILTSFISCVRFLVYYIKNCKLSDYESNEQRNTYCKPSKLCSLIGCIISLVFVIFPIIIILKI